MNVLLSGATGFVGGHLRIHLERAGHEVHTIGRTRADFDWSPASLQHGIEGCDAIVHLAGENILARRWSTPQKERLRSSRVETTALLARLLAERGRGALLSASAVGYYGAHGNEEVGEDTPPGEDFLARLCRDWEAASESARARGLRTVQVRIGLVLGRDGGALQRMLLPFRLGLGGPIGGGQQFHPWIHIEDLCALFRFLLEHEECSGPFNGTAPLALPQGEFARILGRVLGRPAFLPVPAPALRLVLGEAASILLDGVRAQPRRALAAGFVFAHRELEGALRQLLGRAH